MAVLLLKQNIYPAVRVISILKDMLKNGKRGNRNWQKSKNTKHLKFINLK